MDLTKTDAYAGLSKIMISPKGELRHPQVAEYARKLRNSLMAFTRDKLITLIPLPDNFDMHEDWHVVWPLYLVTMMEVLGIHMKEKPAQFRLFQSKLNRKVNVLNHKLQYDQINLQYGIEQLKEFLEKECPNI